MRSVHNSLELLWTNASIGTLLLVPYEFVASPHDRGHIWILTANILVFVIYFFSFFEGNLGYLRTVYLEVSEQARLGSLRILFDLILLMLHLVAFAGMALCLADARSFDTWLIFLLVSDMWWWVYEARTRPVRARRVWCVLLTSNSCPDIRVPVEVDFPARTWVMNNLVTASLLIFFLRVAGPESSVILTVATVLAGVLNRVIDFKKTRFWMF